MRTELMELYLKDKEKAREEIHKMSSERLFAELDDTLQFDVVKAGMTEWTLMSKDMRVYHAIVKELRERLQQK